MVSFKKYLQNLALTLQQTSKQFTTPTTANNLSGTL